MPYNGKYTVQLRLNKQAKSYLCAQLKATRVKGIHLGASSEKVIFPSHKGGQPNCRDCRFCDKNLSHLAKNVPYYIANV